ncbi:MAG: ATPase, T2SS/T4P/T4SS family, partial [Thermoguttaceae bacterium]|nr:ATPase, T2SS/T4P/T4SS family [Thermoguttaceae bacterium]
MAPSNQNLQEAFLEWVAQAKATKEDFIVLMIQRIIQEASVRRASDVHFQPSRMGVDVRMRLDGVLYSIGILPLENVQQIAARIKILANLTTYKTDEPQEGRIRKGQIQFVDRDIRISTAPSLYGERIVGRFFSEGNRFLLPLELGFSPLILKELSHAIQKTSGAILVTGPAGNGKTTTTCALLRAL